jgi:2-haloacid dehalogenase
MLSQPEDRLPVLVFDVNETLLDLHVLQPHFKRIFGDPELLKQFFAQMLLYSQTLTQTGAYADFGNIARCALQMLASIHGTELIEDDIAAVLQSIRSLPAYPDVTPALEDLRSAQFRLVALTNSSQTAAEAQIQSAGLTPLFERIFSVESVARYKPAAEPYLYVARELNLQPSELVMIAAHPWDLMGARAAGLQTAFIQRKGTAWFPLSPPPAITGPTLREVAEHLLRLTRASIREQTGA